jgi:hypothetical protein
VATTTSRLALTKPAGTDAVDIAVLNSNADKIDAASGATVCTSGTRPASPYNGQFIFETDTTKVYVFNSSTTAWVGVTPTSVANATNAETAANALKLNGRTVYVQSATPTGMATGDLWFWGA